ncbi:MAG: asparagine synthase (glutamine-hydrolyzing) [Chloroherpetonaceae bacterium]|nr:asparagine synthase (glutamine-hydrolyzing) [Chthonomonadaceae bacterium]MDW8209086.1 asparagine synthase (glutamine-hydrolyzing) [Chloroherpetonaceae bacterium]
MCGIVGWVGEPDMDLALQMRDCLIHRGPDDAGMWYDPEKGVWLGQRRLSILDLSPAGHQPMVSPGGRYVITYNGEIYNYPELREELVTQGVVFRGNSDTEVLVAAIELWGMEATVERIAGMFAFAVYDRHEDALWLVRDRIGIKPLYYAHRPGQIVFASELQALRPVPWIDREIDRDALASYLQYMCVPAPASILRGVRKLRGGEWLRWDRRSLQSGRYWTVEQAMRRGKQHPLVCSLRDAGEALEEQLLAHVKAHMVSDVPLGAFLSGGIDSSLIVALMQKASNRPVKTYTIGFSEKSHDESGYARQIATHLSTEHHEEILSASNLLALVPRIAATYDEPFADNSCIPTYLLSQFARRDVTVVLAGDGGDELFGGYPRYFWAGRIQTWQQRLTRPGARLIGHLLRGLPVSLLDGPVTHVAGERFSGSEGLSQRIHRFGGYLCSTPADVYTEMIAVWSCPEILLGGGCETRLGPDPSRFPGVNWAEQMMAVDMENFLPDDVLTKVDRASMAVSLEVRVPYLDHRFVEWAWRVPLAMKVASSGDRGKLILREVLSRYVPASWIERPKRGFGVPMHRWLREELRLWAEDMLSETNLKRCGLFDVATVRRVWQEHLKGRNHGIRIWTILAFLQWQEAWCW